MSMAAPRGTPASPAALAGGARQRFSHVAPSPAASHCAIAAKPRPCAALGEAHASAIATAGTPLATSKLEAGEATTANGR